MLVFRISLTKYAESLVASGRAARWNSNDVKVIYTANSRALACLENVVHRSKLGLSLNFSVMEINIPDSLAITAVNLKDLPLNWDQFEYMHLMQKLGDNWIEECKTAVLKIPLISLSLFSTCSLNNSFDKIIKTTNKTKQYSICGIFICRIVLIYKITSPTTNNKTHKYHQP